MSPLGPMDLSRTSTRSGMCLLQPDRKELGGIRESPCGRYKVDWVYFRNKGKEEEEVRVTLCHIKARGWAQKRWMIQLKERGYGGFFWSWSHNQMCIGLIPGSMIKDHSWKSSGWIWICYVKGKCPTWCTVALILESGSWCMPSHPSLLTATWKFSNTEIMFLRLESGFKMVISTLEPKHSQNIIDTILVYQRNFEQLRDLSSEENRQESRSNAWVSLWVSPRKVSGSLMFPCFRKQSTNTYVEMFHSSVLVTRSQR